MNAALEQSRESIRESRTALWFGLLGGAFAWLAHLMGAYAVAEFGCVAGLTQYQFLDVSLVAWLLIGLSVFTALVGAIATLVAFIRYRGLGLEQNASSEAESARVATARMGLITSGLFFFVIVVESLPIVYYLSSC